MENKKNLDCQLITILLDENKSFSNKYTNIRTDKIEYSTIIKDYCDNKNMQKIIIDYNLQSLCFTDQKEKISLANNIKDRYYEEVHIHINNIKEFDEFVKFLLKTNYDKINEEENKIPHIENVNIQNLNRSELVLGPITNEVSVTQKLLNELSNHKDETIFRALAIHFGKLVNEEVEVDYNLVNKLDFIYQNNVENNDCAFFSEDISNKLLNILNDDNSYEVKQISSDIKDMYTLNVNKGEINYEDY